MKTIKQIADELRVSKKSLTKIYSMWYNHIYKTQRKRINVW